MRQSCPAAALEIGAELSVSRTRRWRPSHRLVLTAAVLVALIAVGWPPPAGRDIPHASNPEASLSPVLRAQTWATWRRLLAIIAPCDAAVEAAARATPAPSSPIVPSQPVRRARDACRAAGLSLLSLRAPPAADNATRAAFDAAIERCQSVYRVEGDTHARLARALDRAALAISPARLDLFGAWSGVQEANIDALGCRSAFISVARRAGLPLGGFDPETPVSEASPRADTA